MKKILLIILSILLICTSCEKEEVATDETAINEYKGMTIIEESGIVNVFSSDKKTFEYDFMYVRENHMHNMFVIDDRIYVTAERVMFEEDDSYYELLYLLSYDSDGGDLQSFQILPTDEDGLVRFMWYDSDYNLVTIEEVNYDYTLYKKTVDGDVIFSKSVNVNNIISMVIGENDNIYIATKDEVIVYSNDGDLICSITLDNELCVISSAHGKKPIVKMIGNEYKAIYKYVDIDTKSLEDIELPLSNIIDVQETNILYGEGHNYYIYNKDGLFGYDIDNNVLTEVLDWLNSDINTKLIKSFVIISSEKMAMVYNEANKSYLFILDRIPDNEVQQKEIITLGWIGKEDDTYLNQLVTSFNKNSDEYRIVLMNYYSDEYGMNSYQKLNLEIAIGKEPDILYNNNYIPMLNYIFKNMFVDLDLYLDSEPELKDDLLPFITENTRINNQLPQLITSFSIQTLVTKSVNIEADQNLSIKDFLEIYKSLPTDVSLSNNTNRENLQYYILKNLISECVDYDNGTCDFDIVEMKYFLELMKMLSNSNYRTYTLNESFEKAQEGELYFVEIYLHDYIFYITYKNKSFMPDEATVTGYPTVDGNKRGDNIYSNGFSIFNTSGNKDAAWEFIKYSLSSEFYKNESTFLLMLSTKSGIEYRINSSTLGRKYIYLNNKATIGYYPTNDNTINFEEKYGVGILYNTEDLVNEYMTYLESLNNYVYYDESITNVINEEISTYINSNKSIDDTINAIQSRVSIYMSEIWG